MSHKRVPDIEDYPKVHNFVTNKRTEEFEDGDIDSIDNFGAVDRRADSVGKNDIKSIDNFGAVDSGQGGK